MRFKQQISACFRILAAVLAVVCVFATGRRVSASEQGPSTSIRAGQAAQPPAPATPATQEPVGPTLAVTVDEAVRLALQNNLGLEAERLGPQVASLGVAEARAAYAPVLFSTTTKNNNASPPDSFLSGTGDIITSGGVRNNAGVFQNVFWGGGQYQVAFSGNRTTTTGLSSFNPNLRANIDASFTQPLLRNFKIDGFRQQVRLSHNTEQIADLELRQRVTQVSRLARTGYYNLVSTISGLDLANQSLELSRELLRNNQRKVEVGTMAPIDITEAQAEVARLEESVIVAESQIRSAEDSLRMLLLNPSRPDFWTTKLTPAEQPSLEPVPINVDAAVSNALQNRIDIAVFKKRLESTDFNLEYLRNQKLPEVNLQANYGVVGVAGTQLECDRNTFECIALGQRRYTAALRDVFGNDIRSWSLQFVVRYPIGTSQADAALASARLQRQQQQTNLRELEMVITAQVRNAGRQVTTSLQRVTSTKTARELSEKRLAAEEKRLEVGLSDTFRVFQTQRDLSAAKRAELQAILDYNRALVDFEAVQTVPLAGGQ
jgi:outer membrane protein